MTRDISLDYRAQEGFIYRLASDGEPESSLFRKLIHSKDSTIVSEFGGRKIMREPVPITKEEPLKLELQHFVDCVRAKQKPLVDGEAGMRALDLAFEIIRQIEKVSAAELAAVSKKSA
jgi:predicted dehydrogenase